MKDALGNAFAAVQLSDGLFTAQTIHHYADLFFSGVLFVGRPANVLDVLDRLGRARLECLRFLSRLRSR
jgi:hypothetical protein